ncbi:MAG: CHAT domain-containing protein, partial [Elusimicrobiota bacterium]
DIAYAQSATALTQARTAGKGDSAAVGLLVVADPIFDKSDERLKGSGLEAYVGKGFVTMGVAATRRGAGFDRLEETGVLAETLTAAFGSGALALTGKSASKTKLMSEDLGRYRHLVFATHGILDGDVPYIGEPALVLTQVGNEPGDDGYLKMSEIMGLKLNCDVVALTACKTGLGREVGGEGVLGLGRAFQYAGAKNALVSLWSVSEKSTTMLTAAFFRALKEGKTPRESLKTARTELRRGAYAHPFFWAPFVLIGG